ncbi:MAG: hypothetical protein A2015_14515 [Spirochaetes bacterium GWF1_31_7]|nr:MAG: hypothetical protein A2Y30_03240 [Spirochaetes bacterium GWE1_32_154]OHD48203.1 MAG: hypothetical protein A2Y29_07405 [Spirochaetes bacterium GWE2_31_10]OHD50611.1 MAG: hypothetical protein A2015_14515 [Spirochaetes bacterium GWF1_31_7]OHD74128.1 MAG: hypothetical protein A2355_06085 [Spirochaetes bacterium RIFOXYB1_FULL_32_8]HBD94531.1 hypothetical protein [Spirochaetia bacterium]
MFDKINNVNSRISEIRNYSKSLKNSIKPEFVTNFEQKLQSSLQEKTTDKTAHAKNTSYHPFLQKEVLELPKEDVLSDTSFDMSNSEKKELINKTITAASERYGIEEHIIKSVIKQESAFDQFAVSKAGAMGLMQLMPKTALEMGVSKPFDIEENINGGVKYLKKMLDKYNGDLTLSLAAYNAGPNRVDSANGIPDIKETQDYVKKIGAMINKEIFNRE